MAKYESALSGDFYTALNYIETGILKGSVSASKEDESDFQVGNVRCAVRVYERYSIIGKNRVSLNITLVGAENNLFLSAITSGGSEAIFFKINTFGEESFLDQLAKIVETYKNGQ